MIVKANVLETYTIEARERESSTWRLLASAAKVLSFEHVIETHAGGGLYDSVDVYLPPVQAASGEVQPLISCNREGRVHVLPGDGEDFTRDIFSQLAHGLPIDDAVAWITQHLAATDSNPVMTASLGFMDDLIGVCMGQSEDRWEWRNGYCDTSGGFSCVRGEYFSAVQATVLACREQTGDFLGVPAYRFWFLLRDGVAQLAIEPRTGTCFIDEVTLSTADPGAFELCVRRARADADTPDDQAADLPTAIVTASQKMAKVRAAFVDVAGRLVSQLDDDARPFEPGPYNLTQMAAWYSADKGDTLILVVGSHEGIDSMDYVLAYGLAWQADRDLVFVLPETHAAQTLTRLAWIDSCVRVFVYGPELIVRPAIIPARAEVLAAARLLGLRTTREHDLGEAAALVEPLVTWAQKHWAPLDEVRRPSYVAWHCEGRQVLALSRRPGGVKVIAGVNYTSTVPDGEETPLELEVSAERPLGRKERAQIEARVTRAVSNRLNGQDGGHVEHRLQSRLGAGPLDKGLSLTDYRREYPGWRGPGRPGFLDFLGIDRRHQIHVVETKVNPDDVTVVLQVLDYAIWVMANGVEIREKLNWGEAAGEERVVLDLVCAPKILAGGEDALPASPAIGRYIAGQLEALSPSLGWRIWLVDHPGAEAPELRGLGWRALPDDALVSAAIGGSRWLQRVNVALRAGRSRDFADVTAAAVPEAVAAFENVIARGVDHRHLLNVRSSQALALNLFAPLGEAALRTLLSELEGKPLDIVEAVEFEFSDAQDRLGEQRRSSPHQTQVDVVLRGVGSDQARIMALVEVKFTEEFSACSAYESAGNDQRGACRSSGLYGGDAAGCFQLRNHGSGRRLYDTYLGDEPVNLPVGTADEGGCFVRGQLSQPARSLALGHMLVAKGEIDRFTYVVCAPRGHVNASRRLTELGAVFPDTETRCVVGLEVEDVRKLHADGGRAFSEHYRGLF
jgi:hypothetical protein